MGQSRGPNSGAEKKSCSVDEAPPENSPRLRKETDKQCRMIQQKQKRIKIVRRPPCSQPELTLRSGGVHESCFVLHAGESGVVVVVHDEGAAQRTLLAL